MGLTASEAGACALALLALLAANPPGALAQPSQIPSPQVRPSEARPSEVRLLALRGFDPVSYFLDAGPRPGSARFELAWGGRAWRFVGEANRAAFRADPTVYAPRLGGYDPAGVLDGRIVDADPTRFAVIGERLYLFRDAERRSRFLADPGLARAAEAAWPGLAGLLDEPAD